MPNVLLKLHRRLLPDEPWIGWTPYLWLIYLGFFYIKFFFAVPGWPGLLATALATVLFLYLYFSGYWREGWPLVVNITGIAAIGVVMSPVNFGAGVFFIYAGAFAPFVRGGRTTVVIVACLVATVAVEAWLLGLSPGFWVPPTIITPLVAFANYHFVSMAIKEAALRQSQEEIESLAQVAERERIARDLHDLLGHTLSVITLKAELAGKLLDRDRAAARAEIGTVERISRQALSEVREAVTGYRKRSFKAELDRARSSLRSAGIDTDVRVDGEPLPPAVEGALGFVLREAATNVIRHANASRCTVQLDQQDDRIDFRVSDNGTTERLTEGSGLQGMRERVRALDGDLSVTCDTGTAVRVTIPVPAEAH